MAIAGTNEEYVFVGRYPQTADAQLRVLVPKKWRPESGNETFFFQVKTHGVWGKYLRVMPREAAVRLRNELNEESKKKAGVDDEMRSVGVRMDSADLDGAGKITISDDLARRAGIGKNENIVLVGCLGSFEIWRADVHAKIPEPED